MVSVTIWRIPDMMKTLCAILAGKIYTWSNRAPCEPIESMCNNARNDPRWQTYGSLSRLPTGVKAKGSDNMAGAMLSDMGLNNMADGENSLLSLTLEAIVELTRIIFCCHHRKG